MADLGFQEEGVGGGGVWSVGSKSVHSKEVIDPIEVILTHFGFRCFVSPRGKVNNCTHLSVEKGVGDLPGKF